MGFGFGTHRQHNKTFKRGLPCPPNHVTVLYASRGNHFEARIINSVISRDPPRLPIVNSNSRFVITGQFRNFRCYVSVMPADKSMGDTLKVGSIYVLLDLPSKGSSGDVSSNLFACGGQDGQVRLWDLRNSTACPATVRVSDSSQRYLLGTVIRSPPPQDRKSFK